MFPQLVNSVDTQLSVEFPEQWMRKLSLTGLLSAAFMFPQIPLCETTLDRFMHPQWPIFADTHKSSWVIFRCMFGIKVFIKIILSPFSYNMYICILNIFTIKRDSLQCIPIFYIQNCNFSISIGHFRVPKTLTFKMRRGAQPFLWNEFYLHENEKWFPYQRLST